MYQIVKQRLETLSARALLGSFLQHLQHLPGLLRHGCQPADKDYESRPLTLTTYLDGLRGWAALIVVNYHFLFAFTDIVSIGYGFDQAHKSIWALPGLRLLHDGNCAVVIFFTISGYVCANKALINMTKLAMTPDDGVVVLREFIGNLASSVFRRGFRLYLPTLTVTFMISLLAYLGLFEPARHLFDQRRVYFGHALKFGEPQPKRFSTLSGQLSSWRRDIWSLANPFNPGTVYPELDNHLWTIAYEFRLSMHLYIALVALCWFKPKIRLVCLSILAFLYLCWDHWEGLVFFGGAALAQHTILRRFHDRAARLPHQEKSERTEGIRTWVRLLRGSSYLLAMYLMSHPIASPIYPSPGYVTINWFLQAISKTKARLPKVVGVFILLSQLDSSHDNILSAKPSLLHKVLTCRIARYLGDNMFAIYLVHGTILHSIGYGLPFVWWRYFPDTSVTAHTSGLLFGWMWSMALTLICADVFKTVIETRCVRFTKWLEEGCCIRKS